jgi:uncharacterized protein
MWLKFVLPVAAALMPLSHAAAASFDCKLASGVVEKTVCMNASLSAADDELSSLYKEAVRFVAKGDNTVQSEQRRWLSETRSQCITVASVPSCIEMRYAQRIAELRRIPRIASAKSTDYRYRVSDASNRYDFLLKVSGCGQESCVSPGHVSIVFKGRQAPIQTIAFAGLTVPLNKNRPLVNSAELYDTQGGINIGDFNFDGSEDFSVQSDHDGPYGGPTYAIFLFDSVTQRFAYSPSLSSLTQSSSGLFELDVARKRLLTSEKSGCCFHVDTEYVVRQNMAEPIVRTVYDATGDLERTHTEIFTNGSWIKIN